MLIKVRHGSHSPGPRERRSLYLVQFLLLPSGQMLCLVAHIVVGRDGISLVLSISTGSLTDRFQVALRASQQLRHGIAYDALSAMPSRTRSPCWILHMQAPVCTAISFVIAETLLHGSSVTLPPFSFGSQVMV